MEWCGCMLWVSGYELGVLGYLSANGWLGYRLGRGMYAKTNNLNQSQPQSPCY